MDRATLDAGPEQAGGDSRPKILVVDDEPQILFALTDLLEDHYRVFTAASGRDGLSLLSEQSDVAVIVCDQRMPGMQGDEFFSWARHLSNAARIMFTGFADMSAIIRAVNNGQIQGYLRKPIDPVGLLAAIGLACRAHETAAALEAERELLTGLMDSMPDQIWFKDGDGRILRLNRAMAAALGEEAAARAVGRREDEVFAPEEIGERKKLEDRMIAEDLPSAHQVRLVIDPIHGDKWWSVVSARIRNRFGDLRAMVAIKRDISDITRLEVAVAEQASRAAALEQNYQELQKSLRYDPQTGLLTGVLIDDGIRRLLMRLKKRNARLAICLIAVDLPDDLGESLAHDLLDLAIGHMRDSDVVRRLVTGEFIALCEIDGEAADAEARGIAERIRQTIRAGLSRLSRTSDMTCRIGVAVTPTDDQDFMAAMDLASAAMREARSRGVDIFVVGSKT